MSGKNKYTDFDAITVPLQGSNLIEASAGTGKTYSIAILALRLVLEQQLPVKEILMVTFTRAAVAELEERLRLFIRSAYKCSLGKSIKDDNINGLVQQAISRFGQAQVQQQLKDAVLFLDETSVLTIHGFCQQTLTEFAFETRQLFGAEMLPDMSLVVEDELNKFWRGRVTTLRTALLNSIWYDGMREDMQQLLKEHMGGKRYLGYDERKDYKLTTAKQDEWLEQLDALREKETTLKETLYAYIAANAAKLKAVCEGNAYAKKGLPELIGEPPAFVEEIIKRKKSGYIAKLFPEILEQVEAAEKARLAYEEMVKSVRIAVNCLAIEEVGAGVELFKERNNLLSYDDLVDNLHRALVQEDNKRLGELLQKKYKAVFVDEFQDTDRQQYELFDKAFGGNTLLFYIGDPKQSIYAWRKADIFTYFKARGDVNRIYGMNHNYRSSAPLIDAMNRFFLPADGFDTFYFSGEEETISYIPVNSPQPNTKGLFLKGNTPDVPVSVFKFSNKDGLIPAVAAQTALLLRDSAYSIATGKKDRAVAASDIGILVRTGRQGREVKAALAKLGIPAVTIDDAKVLQSGEALYLLYLVEAVAAPDRSSINRAVLSPFTGLHTADILMLDDEVVLDRFTKYKNRWQQDGVYTALMDFVADFGVGHVLLHGHTENGERIITNLFQLIELLHQAESRKKLSMTELISWLRRGIDGMLTEGDEYMQRVESDEEAVKIVTIHKSKGLEYNIMLAPFLDFVENAKQEFVSFRDPVSGDYTGIEKDRMTEEQQQWHRQQSEQENRRLLYVAITRAVYRCYVFRNESGYNKNSTLAVFLKALEANAPPADLIRFEKDTPEVAAGGYRRAAVPAGVRTAAPVSFVLREENWRKMSYTMLAAKPDQVPRARSFQQADAYEHFIFNTLRRGAKTGNFLHFIFEHLHFTDEQRWDKRLEEGIRRFVPGQEALYLPMLRRLLREVLHAVITVEGISFSLASVGWNKRIAEFEFDFPVPLFYPDGINLFSDGQASIYAKSVQELAAHELEGIMNGKMDLFFEQEGRYYILDWKSNYLGPSLQDYIPAALAVAMNENNYHLQYLIYTLAAKKYLESRIAGFDYEKQFGGVVYVFIRGVRAGSGNGVYAVKPALEKINALEKFFG